MSHPTACAVCSAPTERPRYCSDRCRNRAKYERDKESGYEQIKRQRRNAKYVPKPPRPGRAPCSEVECDRTSWAKGLCRSHYAKARRAQGLDGGKNPVTVIRCTASLFGAYFPKQKPIKVRVAVGVMAYCPWCSAYMSATSPVDRICLSCGTTAVLNEEEVSWVTC